MGYVVDVELRESPIHGLGVFARQFIAKGTVVWKFDPAVDRKLTAEEYEALSNVEKSHVYLCNRTHAYILACPVSRYCNHDGKPNTEPFYPDDLPEGCDIAARDINSGEEITGNYRDWDLNAEQKLQPAPSPLAGWEPEETHAR